MNDDKHFRRVGLRPSASSKTIRDCPGSLWAQIKANFFTLNVLKEDKEAASGTAIHEALAGGDLSRLDDEQLATFYELDRKRQDVIDNFQPEYYAPEMRLWIEDEEGKPIMSGESDVLAYAEEPDGYHLLLVEFKTVAFGEHEGAKTNAQLRRNSVAFAQFIRKTYDREPVKITCVLLQAGHEPSIAEFEGQALIDREAETIAEAKAAISLQNKDKRMPGAWCRYCKALGTMACPESLNRAGEIADDSDDVANDDMASERNLIQLVKSAPVIEAAIDTARAWIKANPSEESRKSFVWGESLSKRVKIEHLAKVFNSGDLETVAASFQRGEITVKNLAKLLNVKEKTIENLCLDNGILEIQKTPTLKPIKP